ncbi:MAG: T9SS type A sorting domain-containing protein [Candidatus Kapabacteria bacterium]|nr:T9SS type A sorting domain-containing protein [Candidatus Kapabacteria bacterium]
MVSLRFTFILAIFVFGFSSAFSQKGSPAFFNYGGLDNTTNKIWLQFQPPQVQTFLYHTLEESSELTRLDAITEKLTLQNFESFSYFISGKHSGELYTAHQFFCFDNIYILPLNFGILPDIGDTNMFVQLNNKFYDFKNIIGYYDIEKYMSYTREWFQQNKGSYILFNVYPWNNDTTEIANFRPLEEDQILSNSGLVSKTIGTSLQLQNKTYYTTHNTVIINHKGENIPISSILEEDFVEISYIVYMKKNLALKITKLEKPFGVLRYSEDIQRISGDTIYTTTHKILKSGITKFQNTIGLETDESSFVKNSAAITFTKYNQHIVSSSLDQTPFVLTTHAYNNSSNSIYKGTVFGRVTNQNWSDISLGNNTYTTNDQTMVQLQDGKIYQINQLSLQPNELVKISYFIDNEKDSLKPVVSMVSIIDTTVYTSITNQKNLFGIEVFPHPVTSNQTSLQYYSEHENVVTVTVYSIDGIIQTQSKHNVVNGTNSINIDCSKLPTGSYFVKIVESVNSPSISIPLQIVR